MVSPDCALAILIARLQSFELVAAKPCEREPCTCRCWSAISSNQQERYGGCPS